MIGNMQFQSQAPLVSIIMLTLNELDHTVKCLASIEAHTPEPHELIIVDNGSTDGTVEFLRRYLAEHDHVRVVANSTNRGFAAGNNQGLSLAEGEYVLLLNNDTLVVPVWLERMLAVFGRHPQVGIVGPMSNYVSGPQLMPDVPYRTLPELEAFAARWTADHAAQSMAIARVVGFCLLARKAVIERIGGLDERFGSGNFEDDDFCIRAAQAGWEARIAQDAFIHHTGSQTFKGAKIDYRKSMLRNWELFKAKWGIAAGATLEQGYRLTPPPWDASRGYVPLPDVGADHQPELGRRWWQEEPAEGARPRVRLGFIRRDPDIAAAQASLERFTDEAAPAPVWPDAATVNEQLASADYLALLAPDVLLTKGWLEALVAVAEADPSIAAIGPTSNEAPGPQKVKQGYQSLKKELQKFAARRARRHKGAWESVPGLGAFCLLLNTHAVRQAGGLDECRPLADGLWDLYRRLKAEGFAVACARGVYVHHGELTEDEGARYDETTAAARVEGSLTEARGSMEDGLIKEPAEGRPKQRTHGWLGRELDLKDAPGGAIEINGVKGFLIPGDLQYLFHRARALATNSVIVEIGSFLGLSAIIMANGLAASNNYGARIYCVDKWEIWMDLKELGVLGDEQLYETFITNIRNAHVDSFVHPIRNRSTEAAADFEAHSVDMLFIDGDHTFEGCYADLEAWYPKLRPGGILIGHDCVPGEGVLQAVERFASEHDLDYSITEPPAAHYMFETRPRTTDGTQSIFRQAQPSAR